MNDPRKEAIAKLATDQQNELIKTSKRGWQPFKECDAGPIASLSDSGLIAVRVLINGSKLIEAQGKGWIDVARQIHGTGSLFEPKEFRLTLDGEAFQDRLKDGCSAFEVIVWHNAIISPLVNEITDMAKETKGKKPKGPTCNQLMSEEFLKNPDSASWTKDDWAKSTGKGKSTVIESDMWNSEIFVNARAVRDATKELSRSDRRRK